MIEKEIELICGFCLKKDNYIKKKTTGGSRHKVANTIRCTGCGHILNHNGN